MEKTKVVRINYDNLIDTLVRLNNVIHTVDNGYLWRELCGIESFLRESVTISSEQILTDVQTRIDLQTKENERLI